MSDKRREAPISSLGLELLAYLLDVERGHGGYELFGVRGWATVWEIQEAVATRRRRQKAPGYQPGFEAGEELRALAARRLLSRVDARTPGASTPVWLYRITDTGARHVSAAEDVQHQWVKPPRKRPETRVFIKPHVRAALDALKHADQHAGGRVWVPGEPEWRTSRELTAWLARRRGGGKTPRIFYSDDMAACVQLGLAERRDDPKIIYRLTPLGRTVRPLIWREPAIFL
ncbi:MAG TPA: hypothetical protein VFR37_05000 [Longimicrobium sp.]|nr:hypothetical protein [Longimicrobium sp.]